MIDKTHKEFTINLHADLAVNESDQSQLNNWLQETGVKVEMKRDGNTVTVKVFKEGLDKIL